MTSEASPVTPTDAPSAATDGETLTHGPAAVQTLKDAMRRARIDDAERAGVLADLRAARIGRLEILQEALKPLVAQIPTDVDYFDIALMPGVNPRLFIDMIGFVEMGRDARAYQFVQDTRHGRTKLGESSDVDTMVDMITNYVARRLLERDKALAAEAAGSTTAVAPVAKAVQPKRKGGALHWAGIAFAFLIDLLGSIAFFSILAGAAWIAWNRLHGHV